jgi:hypothetical protein
MENSDTAAQPDLSKRTDVLPTCLLSIGYEHGLRLGFARGRGNAWK